LRRQQPLLQGWHDLLTRDGLGLSATLRKDACVALAGRLGIAFADHLANCLDSGRELTDMLTALLFIGVQKSIARLAFENPIKLPDQVRNVA
jgi:hypothetical protein